MSELDELSLRVLRLVSVRPAESGFDLLEVEGEPNESVSSVVERLHFDRLVDATLVTDHAGTTPDGWAPSNLTDKGRRVLASLDAVVCPTCFTPMRVLDATSRAGSNDNADRVT